MNNKVNCITFTSIIKVNGNVNGSWGEDIISTIKKIRMPDSTMRTYISGQALRRMSRGQFNSLGYTTSAKDPNVKKDKQPLSTQCDPEKYIDDDLYGYMKTSGKSEKVFTRISPVRVSPAMSLFPYYFERDLGLQNNNDIKKDNRFYETEISMNYYVYTVLIEADRVGIFDENPLSIEERKKRIKTVIKSFQYLWGGGHQSRLLADLSTKFIAYQSQKIKKPSFMDYVSMDEKLDIDSNLIQDAINQTDEIRNNLVIGISKSLNMDTGILKESGNNVLTIDEAFKKIYKDVDSMDIADINERN